MLQAAETYMKRALELALKAAELDEVPVGALIVDSATGDILSEAYNQRETKASALAHAEILAIEKACQKLGRWRLSGCILYTTLEPCVMCSGAILQARLDQVFYGASDPKGGGHSLFELLQEPRLNHRVELSSGVLAEDCGQLLSHFFQKKRKK